VRDITPLGRTPLPVATCFERRCGNSHRSFAGWSGPTGPRVQFAWSGGRAEGCDSGESHREKCVARKRIVSQSRIAVRAFQQSVCSIVRHARLGVMLKTSQATAVAFGSLPVSSLGARHEHRRNPAQPYCSPTGATACKGRLIVFKVSDDMCYLAVSRATYQPERRPTAVSGRPRCVSK